MMTTVLIVLCLYLATCYAYGGVLLVGVLRGRGAAVDLDAPPSEASPRLGAGGGSKTTGTLHEGAGSSVNVRHGSKDGSQGGSQGAGRSTQPSDGADSRVRAAA